MKTIETLRTYLLFTVIFCFAANAGQAQAGHLTRYFDSLWNPVSKDSSFFFTTMDKTDGGYMCKSFWTRSGKINCKSFCSDTNFTQSKGILLRYYQNGQTEDSTQYNSEGKVQQTFHFYQGGRLHVHYSYNSKTRKEVTEAFDPKGSPIPDFVFMANSKFGSGAEDWQAYLNNSLKTRLVLKQGPPVGRYEVRVRFMVSKAGKPSNIEIMSGPGYGMEEEARRVISKSPRWQPAIYLNKPVDTWLIQPVVFVIREQDVKDFKAGKLTS